MSGPTEIATYQDVPMLKQPVWIWTVPVYFWIGGAAGAGSVVAAVAQGVDRQAFATTIERSRRLGAFGAVAGTALLVHDLGRPSRALNMLRVFRPTSALNMGSWTLSAYGSSTSIAAMAQGRGMNRLGDAAGLAAGVAGLPMSGYTAVLLSDTAVPLWQSTRKSLPFLFVASALASACALLGTPRSRKTEETMIKHLGTLAALAELTSAWFVHRDASLVDRVGRPLRRGLSGALWKAACALTAAGALSSVVAKRHRSTRASHVLATAGALAFRFAVFHAGKASARDPEAAFAQQKADSDR